MGYMQAKEMSRLADLDTALSWHLQSNHYPPIPLSMIPACKAAIDAYRDDDITRDILLPLGIRWRGEVMAPASALVNDLHLVAFTEV